MSARPRLACVLWLGAGAACAGVEADLPQRPASESARPDLAGRVERGPFASRLLLTGKLEAVRSAQITAPRVPSAELQIRWMEEDGAFVRAGQKVLEFDNTTFAGDLEDKKLLASKEGKELRRLGAQARAEAAEKAFAVEERRAAYEKARLEADVPRELLPLREFQEKQLAMERARAELEKAREDYESHTGTTAQEIALKKLALEKTLFEIARAEAAIEALVLEAPRDGVLVVSDIPWEGRKIQEGDNVWPGFLLLKLPDLTEIRVVAQLSDVDDGRVEPGMKAEVALDAHPETVLAGEVLSVTPVAQETSPRSLRRAFTVYVALTETDPERMRPGMAARVAVTIDEREDVLLVPRDALDLEGSPPLAFLADGGTRKVELGPCDLFTCILEEGLAPGAELRLRGLRR